MSVRVWLPLVACVAACGVDGGSFRYRDATMQMRRGEELALCTESSEAFIGTPSFHQPWECRRVPLPGADWIANADGVWALVPRECPTDCSALVAVDPDTGEATTLLDDAQPRSDLEVAGRMLVWLDRRHDADGLCFGSDQDPDCAVDLYGYDLDTHEEVRLTNRSTVAARGRFFRSIETDGSRVLFVDVMRSPRNCWTEGKPLGLDVLCPSDLMVVDTADRSVSRVWSGTAAIFHPSPQGDDLGWAYYYTDRQEVFVTSATTALTSEEPTAVLPVDAQFEVEAGWLVVADDGELSATHLRTGERRTALESEVVGGFVTDGGHVVWRSDRGDRPYIRYDLATDRAAAIMEF